MGLIIKYDSEADVLKVKIREEDLIDEEILNNDIVLGYGKNGKIVSIEILDASKKGLFNALTELAKIKKKAVDLILSKT